MYIYLNIYIYIQVSLADNQLTGLAVEAVARGLATNSSLQAIDLSENLITHADIAPLAAVLSWNSALLRQLPDAGVFVCVCVLCVCVCVCVWCMCIYVYIYIYIYIYIHIYILCVCVCVA